MEVSVLGCGISSKGWELIQNEREKKISNIENKVVLKHKEEQIVTSKIVNKRVVGDKIEVITHNGSCYVIDVEHKLYDISFAELVVMRIGVHSPERILEMREQLKTPKLN